MGFEIPDEASAQIPEKKITDAMRKDELRNEFDKSVYGVDVRKAEGFVNNGR